MAWNHNFLKPGEKIIFDSKVSRKNASLAEGALIGELAFKTAGFSGGSSTGASMSITTGRLFLTNQRLVFVKHLLLMFGTKIVEEIPLSMIDCVKEVPDRLYSYIKIDTKDKKSRLFDIASKIDENGKATMPAQVKEEWIEKINSALGC